MKMLYDSMFFGVMLSLVAYSIGVIIKQKLKLALFNPLLISIGLIIAFLAISGMEYDTYYKSTTIISYMLTPATVCLAVPMYEQMKLLKKNMKAILAGILSGTITSFICVLVCALIFKFDHTTYVTLLPKSITTAIGMGVSEEMGGTVTITIAAIIITGIVGNMMAETICKLFRIKEPVAKGVAIGTASHAMGTAKAMEMGYVEGAMSSLSIAVAGVFTVVLSPLFAHII